MVSTIDRPVTTNGHSVGGRAAIYIRVSTHKQEDGASLEVQLEACRRYCEKSGLDVVAEFKDVESGLHVDRAQYQQALALARSKGFDSLVVYRYDRSGRDDAEYMTMLRDFAKQGITLVSASGESPDPLYQKLAGVLAWDESRRISIRTSGSKMKRHTEGKWNGKPVFGYGLEKHPEGGSYLVPNEHSALVTEMFTRYASGKCSLMDLRDFLNEAGIKKSRYSVWYIIKNPVYLGLVPHGLNDRSPFKPKAELHWTEGKHQPLTDQGTFDRAQMRLTENKSRQKGGPAAKYLFSGLVYCGNCGAKYQARTFKRRGSKVYVDYRCNRKHGGVGDCQSNSVLESRIRAAIMPPIDALINKLNDQDMREAIRQELVQQQEDKREVDAVIKLGLTEKLEKLENRLSQWEDLWADGEMPRDRFIQRRNEVLPQIDNIRAQLAERPQMTMPDLEPLFAMADVLEGQPPDDAEWREIIAGLVEKILIEKGDGDSKRANVTVVWKPEFATLAG